MEARIRRIVRKFLALGLALNVGLSAWGVSALAQSSPAEQQNQIQSAEKAVSSGGAGSEVKISVEVKGATPYQDYTFDKMLDGDRTTFAWVEKEQAVGDTFTFTFESMVELSKVTLIYPQGVDNNTDVKEDYIGKAVLEVKGSGNWEQVAEISGNAYVNPMPFDKKKVRQVRIRITEFKDKWPKIAEMEFEYVKWQPSPQDPDKTELGKAIDQAEAVKATDKYKNADADKKKAFDEALTKAQAVLADANANEAAVNAAAADLTTAMAALNGITPESLQLNVFPSLRQYKAKDGKFEAASGMKLVVVASKKANQDARLREVAELISQEFGAYGIPENKALPVVYGEKSEAADGDIVLELKDQVKDVPKAEGFAVQVDKKVEIQALTANGAMYALRSVMQYLKLKQAMPYGDIIDYPETDERALHLDMGRKYFTPEWIKNLIKELSFSRLNTLQLHFSEHEGYRLESETYPDIMSDQYITKAQMREIIATAKKYGVEIIPSFDNPGHLRTALRHHQDLCLVDKWGQKDTGALDINKEEARQFVKNIIKEYAELFVDSRYFHIGGDEFINFNNFGNYPSLTEFGQKHVPQGVTANGQDGYMAYINEIAKYTYDLGFVPRIWNDGVYRLNMNPHIDLHDYIQVCYWTRWDRNMASVDRFMEKGHDLINVNDMMYYVLTTYGKAYYNKPQPEKIYNTWHGGVFSGNNNGRPQTYELPHDKIKGACYAIWCDVPRVESEEQVSDGIFYSLRAMAEKSWAGKQEKGKYDDFRKVIAKLGKAPGTEKPLPSAGAIDLKDLIEVRLVCQSGSGQILGLPEARLGREGELYQFTAPSFKGFELEDGAPSLSGTFNTNKTITLTYKRFVSLKPLEEALENVFAEDAYIDETYQEYKEAVEKARALLTASSVTDIQITKAISDMSEAAKKLV